MGACISQRDNSLPTIPPVLLVGLPNSGKSTFAKQMKIIYQRGFEENEVVQFKEQIQNTVIAGIQELLEVVESNKKWKLSNHCRKHSRYFKDLEPWDIVWDDVVCNKVKQLWEDKSVQKAWRVTRTTLDNNNCLEYVMKNIEKITKVEYTPSNEDILRVRQRTTGITVTKIMTESHSWTFIDLGGQKPEREKWKQLTDESIAFIFFVAVNEFNVPSTEDTKKTNLQLALEIFSQFVNSKETEPLAPILFLNKIDLFQEKIQKNKNAIEDFNKYFPSFKGTATPEKVLVSIKEEFIKVAKNREIVSHFTCTLDTSTMSYILDDVKLHVLKSNVNQYF